MIIYVNAAASRQGNGSKEMPFKHINDAARIAMPGDEILVAPGTYREYVNPIHSGTEDARIIYRSAEPLGAIITGAEEVKNWKPYQGNTWVTRVDNGIFNGVNPYTEIVNGDWYFSPRDPETRKFLDMHRGAVYLNDRMMYESTDLEDCLAGTPFADSWEPQYAMYKWYTEQDGNETVIYANFQGKNPNEENVEINVRQNCFMPREKFISFITLSGFTVCKAATNWAPPAAYQDGMIGTHWSKGWIIEDCDISNSKCCGISLGNYAQTEKDNNNYFTKYHWKSATQMERDTSCIAQHDGWGKDKVGSHIVRRCHIHDCGQTGIVGRNGCVFSIIEDNHIHHINNMQQLTGAEVAGIKFHCAIDVIFRRNHIHHCTMGIWTDWQAQGTRYTQNLLHDNHVPEFLPQKNQGMGIGQDIFVEVSHGPTLIDNNILLSKTAIRWATQGIAFVHNLTLGSFSVVGSGTDQTANGINQPRYTPYHFAHSTDIAGFMSILHGDNRIYNNIMIQGYPNEEIPHDDMGFDNRENMAVGSFVFNEYPTYDEWIKDFMVGERVDMTTMFEMMNHHFDHLPVWIDGNAYFMGAKPWKNESNVLVNADADIKVELVEENGKYKVQTNVYDFLGDFKNGMINSDILGKAFEPEERYENPDGTDIIFNEDYFGNHRGTDIIPGPVADPKEFEEYVY